MASTAAAGRRCVLIVLQNGSHGTVADFALLKQLLELRAPCNYRVVAAKCNQNRTTDDGISACGWRLAAEIAEHVTALRAEEHEFPGGVQLSCVGHSLGGLILRDAVFHLAQRYPWIVFDTFCSVATPHAGVRHMPTRVLRGLGHGVSGFSRTYQELFLLDDERAVSTGLMSWQHMMALAKFRRRITVGVLNDCLVPPMSALLQPVTECAAATAFDRRFPLVRFGRKYASLKEPAFVTLPFVNALAARFSAAERSQHLKELSIICQLVTNGGAFESYAVDYSNFFPSRASSRYAAAAAPKTMMGATIGSHRAVICKSPFFMPQTFGEVSDWLCDELLHG